MASATPNLDGTFSINLSADAAEALMETLRIVTVQDGDINDEFEQVWDDLVDNIEHDNYYASLRFDFKEDENLVYKR